MKLLRVFVFSCVLSTLLLPVTSLADDQPRELERVYHTMNLISERCGLRGVDSTELSYLCYAGEKPACEMLEYFLDAEAKGQECPDRDKAIELFLQVIQKVH